MPRLIKERAQSSTTAGRCCATRRRSPTFRTACRSSCRSRSGSSGASALIARGDIGVWLAPADDPAALADDVARLPVIAVDFPQFTDGRGYSTHGCCASVIASPASCARSATSQRDQLYYLAQCGFDAFAIRDGATPRMRWTASTISAMATRRRPFATPWFRRRQAAARRATCGSPALSAMSGTSTSSAPDRARPTS